MLHKRNTGQCRGDFLRGLTRGAGREARPFFSILAATVAYSGSHFCNSYQADQLWKLDLMC